LKLLFIFIFSLFIYGAAFPQNERGIPQLINYPSKDDYRADSEVWDCVRDSIGRMYFAHFDGVLEYNASTWKLHKIPGKISGGSLAINKSGRLFSGSVNEIGYFQRIDDKLEYTSLMNKVPDEFKSFARIWAMDTLDQHVYFMTYNVIFDYFNDSLHTLKPNDYFSFMFRSGQTIYVQDMNHGLFELQNSKLIPKDTSAFFKENYIARIIPAPKNKLFIFTRKNGLFLYDGKKVNPVKSVLSEMTVKFRAYCSAVLDNGEIALGTIGGGILIIDSLAQIKIVINKEQGLRSSTITSLYNDHSGNLWVGSYEGISKIKLPSSIGIFYEKQGLYGMPKSTIRHNGKLYQGTLDKFFSLKTISGQEVLQKSGTSSVFSEIDGVKEDCGYMLSIGKDLFVSTSLGVFLIDDNGNKLVTKRYSLPLVQSKTDPNRIFVGTYGLTSLYRKNGDWKEEGLFDDFEEDIYQIHEESDSVLWMRTFNQGIIRATIHPDKSRKMNVRKFGLEDGLPSLQFSEFGFVEGKLRITSETGILAYDSKSSRFVSDTNFVRLFPDAPSDAYIILQQPNGDVWMAGNNSSGSYVIFWKKNSEGVFVKQNLPFILDKESRIQKIYTDEFNITWISTAKGLIQYNSSTPSKVETHFFTQISSVTTIPKDSVLAESISDFSRKAISLSYPDNSLRFKFAALSYADEARNSFRFILEGYEKDWSDWSEINEKDYTNLDAGNYKFRVQSRNAFGVLGTDASFSFSLSPPWWKTWWFRSFILLGVFYIGYLYNTRRITTLKKEKKKQEDFSRQLINLQEMERKRIAHELHDSISQSLLSIKNRASMAMEKRNLPNWTEDQLNVILSSSTGAIQEIKQITHNLRPYLLDRVGFTQALHSLFRNFMESTSIKVIAEVDEIDSRLNKGDDIHLYRIIQESFNNVQKHAHATELKLFLVENEKGFTLSISDNGIGFTPYPKKKSSLGGLGIDGIEERIKILHGSFRISSEPGKGTQLNIEIPFRKEND